MNFVKNVILYIKNIFKKQEKIKLLESPKNTEKEKISFLESLKYTQIEKVENNKIETLICKGDGLGIKKKISY